MFIYRNKTYKNKLEVPTEKEAEEYAKENNLTDYVFVDDTNHQYSDDSENERTYLLYNENICNENSDLTHLFKVGQKVRVRFEDEGKLYSGVVKETYNDHIIVDVAGISDHCWFDSDMLGDVYPEYNFKQEEKEMKVTNVTNFILEGKNITNAIAEASSVLRDKGITSTDDVNELVLYISNDGDIYRQRITPIIANLKKKAAKGNYDRELAVKAFQYAADDGVRKYDKEFGSGQGKLFLDKPTRTEIAKELRDRYEEEILDN